MLNFKLTYMITQENIKYFIETISPETMQSELDKPNDFILLQAHIFNVGGYATIESMDYDEEVDEDAQANGNLFCDKDTFLQMCEELEIFEY
jgi:hypothetical protein